MKKRLRSMLVLAILAAMLTVTSFAADNIPSGFRGMESVNLEVDSGLGWCAITEDVYDLTYDENVPIYVAGNSGTNEKNVSNLAITVSEPGQLSFDYAVSSRTSGHYFLGYSINEAIPVGAKKDDYTFHASNNSQEGKTTWVSHAITITEDDFKDGAETATVYFAYARGGTLIDTGTTSYRWYNYAALRNVKFSTGNREDVVQFQSSYTPEMGNVSAQLVTVTTNAKDEEVTTLTDADLGNLKVGSTYRLTAKANEGYRHYGWIRYFEDSGVFYPAFQMLDNGVLDVVVNDTTYYIPVFAKEGTYIMRKGSDFYPSGTSIAEVVEKASSGEVVVLLHDVEIDSDLTIPANVTLYVPFRDIWNRNHEGNRLYRAFGGSDAICDGEDYAHTTLTIKEGVTLTVKGTLATGSFIGRQGQDFQGHTSGFHGRVENNGTIEVYGTLTSYGIVAGEGTVIAKAGGQVYEALVICDFSGGSNTAEMFDSAQMPFRRYSAQNIQCKLEMEKTAALTGLAAIWANGGYNSANMPIIGPDETFVFQTKEDGVTDGGTILVRTYDPDKNLNDTDIGHVDGIGRTIWEVNGGLTIRALTVLGFTTETADFPVPYNMELFLDKGIYDIPYGLRIMPGAQVTVKSDATMRISGKLIVLDGLIQGDMSTDRYPDRGELTDHGFSGSGELVVDGKLVVTSGAMLGGLVQSNGGGTLEIEEGAYLRNSGSDLGALDQTKSLLEQSSYDSWAVITKNNSGVVTAVDNWVQQDGAPGAYDDNTTWFNLPARFYTAEGITNITQAGFYRAAAAENTIEDTFECLYVADGEYKKINGVYQYVGGSRDMLTGEETFNRAVNGVWSVSTPDEEDPAPDEEDPAPDEDLPTSTVVGRDDIEVKIKSNVDEDTGITTLTISVVDTGTENAASGKFVHLVKYTDENGARVSLKNKEGDCLDGEFEVPEGGTEVTVESAMLGDMRRDGALNLKDVVLLRRELNAIGQHLDELGRLAADFRADKELNLKDVVLLRRTI